MGFLEEYNAKHQHPMNRLTHTFGIPMVAISVPLFFFNWQWALGLFIVGWIFQFVGHIFEGKAPAFFSDPRFLLVGVVWWFKKILGIVPKNKP